MNPLKSLFKGFRKGQKLFGDTMLALPISIVLTFVYIVGVGLTSIIAKMFGKHFLDTKLDSRRRTYWEDLDLTTKKKEAYYRQF